ncbi:MAG: hypothetical protein AABW58_04295 [Nanoarchaeota archaeon]
MEEQKKQNAVVPEELKDKFKEVKNNISKFKKDILKKFDKYITGIAVLPNSRILDEDYPEEQKEEKEKQNPKEIGILVLVDDSDSKKMSKYELKDKLVAIIEKSAKEVDPNFKAIVMLMSELKENCFDAKYEVLEAIALSAIFYDPADVLAAFKISEVHKKMALKKFEKYIVSYVAIGSLFRGEKSNDIDVLIVVDDTDVKKMSRIELKDKLRAIIIGLGYDASKITGINKAFHIQVHILTDFWESLKDASPVIFTFLRDGVPLYDRGVFMPWKLLLQMGRIKPSPEAIDMHMDIADKLIQRAKGKLLSVVGEDLYYATLNPAQAALMLYGIPPPTHRETIKLLMDIFVKKEKLLEKRYVDILDKTFRYFKGIEHGTTKEISGKEVDQLLKDVNDYLKRLNKLFLEIEEKSEKKKVLEFYEGCVSVAQDLINVNSIRKNNVLDGFEELVKQGKVPEKFLRTLKTVVKAKEDYEKGKITKQEVEKIRKEANMFMRTLIDIVQRKRSFDIERLKFRVKYNKDKIGEVLIIDNTTFITKDLSQKDKLLKGVFLNNACLGELKESSLKEFENFLKTVKNPKKVAINENTMSDLKRIFGNDTELILNF